MGRPLNGLPRRNASSMATLQQTLRGLPQADDQISRGPGGVLQQKKTLQQATQQLGAQVAPTTPLGAEIAGVGPQSAKMAGTPQQLGAALKAAGEPAPDLQTALRRKQARKEATAEEQQRITKSADMQKLGGLGDRVTNFIDDQMQKLAVTQEQAAIAPAAVGTVQEFEGKPVVDIADTLQKLRTAAPGTEDYNQLLIDVNTYFGRDQQGKLPLSATELASLYQSADQTIGAAAGKTIEDLSVEDLLQDPQFGYDTKQLSELLGVPETEIAGLTVKQLSDKVNQVASTEFGQAQALRQKAVSPLAGAAERGLAREAGRELSAVGVRASEADVQRIAEAVSRADQVTFAGQVMSAEDALSDDNISAVVKDYLESPEDSDIRKELRESEPELAKFIDSHQAVLTEAAKRIDTGATEFKKVQDTNKKLQTETFNGIELDSNLMKSLVPGWGKFATKVYNKEDIPLFKYAASLTPNESRNVANELNIAYGNNPEVAKELSTLNSDQIQTLGIGKKDSNWDKMNKYNTQLENIQSIPEDDSDSLIREVYSDTPSLDAAKNTITYGNILSGLGLESGVNATSIDPSTLKNQALDNKSKVSVTQAASGNIPKFEKPKLGSPKFPKEGSIDSALVIKLAPVLADGDLTSAEISDPNSPISSFSLDELIRVEDLSKSPTARIDQGTISQKRQQATDAATSETIKQNTDGNMMGNIDRYMGLLSQDPRRTNPEIVKPALQQMAISEVTSGRDWYTTMDNVYEKLNSLGLITPEFRNKFNQQNEQRKSRFGTPRKNLGGNKYLLDNGQYWDIGATLPKGRSIVMDYPSFIKYPNGI